MGALRSQSFWHKNDCENYCHWKNIQILGDVLDLLDNQQRTPGFENIFNDITFHHHFYVKTIEFPHMAISNVKYFFYNLCLLVPPGGFSEFPKALLPIEQILFARLDMLKIQGRIFFRLKVCSTTNYLLHTFLLLRHTFLL